MPTSREPNREKRRIKSRRGNTVSIPAASTIHPPASTGTVRWGREGGVVRVRLPPPPPILSQCYRYLPVALDALGVPPSGSTA